MCVLNAWRIQPQEEGLNHKEYSARTVPNEGAHNDFCHQHSQPISYLTTVHLNTYRGKYLQMIHCQSCDRAETCLQPAAPLPKDYVVHGWAAKALRSADQHWASTSAQMQRQVLKRTQNSYGKVLAFPGNDLSTTSGTTNNPCQVGRRKGSRRTQSTGPSARQSWWAQFQSHTHGALY